uniref:AlNc14C278G10080 protein n=1 Tax=Albugo laibachii Nc14 TaxID=890382 RepID=F0WUT2_9STRA|nr:AlNc14C278G10080 [Albugo laibachii Nc14]|eukprot:CCA25168.1 AlNc14C278G10080 [Albugo laibachii Nc14]
MSKRNASPLLVNCMVYVLRYCIALHRKYGKCWPESYHVTSSEPNGAIRTHHDLLQHIKLFYASLAMEMKEGIRISQINLSI